MNDKRGVSGIILTIIMIVLVLAAVVVVWGVINNLIANQTEQVDVSQKCLDVDIKATKLTCIGLTNSTCDVTLSRSSTGDAISGVKLVFTNASGGTNFVSDVVGNIGLLQTTTVTAIETGPSIINTNGVSVTPYFTDDSGNEQLC